MKNNLVKYYIINHGQCPGCKKGELIQKFYLQIHPYQGEVRIGGDVPEPNYSLEFQQAACDHPECGQMFKRQPSDNLSKKIYEELSREVCLVKEDTKSIFPEHLIDEILPSPKNQKFSEATTLELLSKMLGREIKGSQKWSDTKSRLALRNLDPQKFDFVPDDNLYGLFKLLSQNEQERLEALFAKIKNDSEIYEALIGKGATERLEVLRLKPGVIIPKGTHVQIVIDDNDFNLHGSAIIPSKFRYSEYTPIDIATGDLKGIHYLPAGSVISESDLALLELKEFWPTSIMFEKPIVLA